MKKAIVIIYGLPGSGKSYFAEHLAKEVEAGYISSDKCRKELTSSPDYSQDHKDQVYQYMLEQLEEELNKHYCILIDATFYKKYIRQWFIEKAEMLQAKLLFIEIVADEAIIEKRLEKDREDSDADLSVYKKLKAVFEENEEEHLVLKSTNSNLTEMIETALAYFKSKKIL